MVYFWACEVTDTKAAVVKVPEGFVLNVCNATLALATVEVSGVSLGLETKQMDDNMWKGVVCHLGFKAQAYQVKLDLVFGLVGQIKFYVASGSGKINLTGYFQPGPPSDLMLDEESIPAVVVSSNDANKKGKKRDRAAVTWDQNASDDSEDEETPAAKKPVVASTPAKTQPKEDKKPVAAAAASTPTDGAAKKKRKNKNKKKAAPVETKQ